MNDIQDLGLVAYERGDFQTAFDEWQKLADAGNVQAYHNLAILYQTGQGIEQNDVLAKMWCQKAANAGLASAQAHLGDMMLFEGDMDKAQFYWKQAAEQGHAEALYSLAQLYHQGDAVPQDLDEAADYYEAAAQQEHPLAQFNLGVLYANAQQYANARYWWERAQSQGEQFSTEALKRLSELGY